MLQIRRRADLGQKAIGADDRSELRAKELDGDLAIVAQVVGEVDRRHSTLADVSLDAVPVGEGVDERLWEVAHAVFRAEWVVTVVMYGSASSSSTESMQTRLGLALRRLHAVTLLGAAFACGDVPREARPSRTSRSAPADTGVRVAATCVVERVADGDSLVCEGDRRVRLLLIDTPELSQAPFGRQSMQTLERLAPVGTTLRIETDVEFRDRFGRTLGYLWTTDGRLINEEMVAAGMAVVLVYPPNVKYVERLRAASAEAKRKKVGLWTTSAFECAPRDHRAGRC